MEWFSAQQLGLQLDNSIFQSLQLNLVNLVSWRGIQIPRLDLQRTFIENKKIYPPNLSSQNLRKILVHVHWRFWSHVHLEHLHNIPSILNQNQSPLIMYDIFLIQLLWCTVTWEIREQATFLQHQFFLNHLKIILFLWSESSSRYKTLSHDWQIVKVSD